jgi:hypothetical protein
MSEKKAKDTDGGSPPDIEESFYYALSHEIRRNILRMIGESGKGSFTEFKRTLKVSTGTLYHHLDVLKDLVVQDEKKKYILSTLGKHAYDFLIRNYDSMESTKVEERKTLSEFLNKAVNFAPRRMIELINKKLYYGWIISGLIILCICVLVAVAGINSVYIFFLPYQEELTIGIRFWLSAKFFISLVVAIAFSELMCRFLFKKSENTVPFIVSFSIGLLPMIIYLIIHTILEYVNPLFVEGILMKIIMVGFQIVAILFVSYIQIVMKYIKLERSLLITFLVHYIAFNIILFTSI